MKRGAALLMAAAGLIAAAPADRPVRTLDLQAAFATLSPWRITVTQARDQPDPIMDDRDRVPGTITACLSPDGRRCNPTIQQSLRLSAGADDYETAHYLDRLTIVRPRAGRPLLLIQQSSLHSVNGDQRRATDLYGYDRAGDRFERVYHRLVGLNNNQEVRYIDAGPLAGAIVSAEPTQDAPFGFWITISRIGTAGTYRQVLRYRSATRYGDGNPLAVIDSDMPELQRRLGLWHPGRPLPAPRHCTAPRLIRGELWCSVPSTTR